jgi:ribosomal protein S27AE
MIDYWELSKNFAPGDFVQKYVPSRNQNLSPYVGRVTAVLRGIGFLDVQWPFGNERISPEDVILVNKEFATYLPPMNDFSYYPGLEQERARLASKLPWRTTELPIGFHTELAKLWHRGASEVEAYDELWHRYAAFSADETLRDEVAKVYAFSDNAFTMFLDEYARKTAMYWVSQNRQHRATQGEVQAKRPNCPRCGTSMRKATYKMAEGQRMRLFACPKDLYLIKQNDILGPGGEPVAW